MLCKIIGNEILTESFVKNFPFEERRRLIEDLVL